MGERWGCGALLACPTLVTWMCYHQDIWMQRGCLVAEVGQALTLLCTVPPSEVRIQQRGHGGLREARFMHPLSGDHDPPDAAGGPGYLRAQGVVVSCQGEASSRSRKAS
jgi:hypothetical protein